jgi:hypothetical protein
MDDSTHVKMLIIEEMWKLIKPLSIIAKHGVACVLIYFNKCKMWFMNNGFNMFLLN